MNDDVFILLKATDPRKKYMVIGRGDKIQFGQKGYEDFTMHKDERRKLNYLRRHSPRERWFDISTPGAWSAWLLWNKETIGESISDMERLFGIKIINRI